jgi:hypothetical protein
VVRHLLRALAVAGNSGLGDSGSALGHMRLHLPLVLNYLSAGPEARKAFVE